MDASAAAVFARPLSGRTVLTHQRAAIAELFSPLVGAAVSDFRDARVCRHFLAGLCCSTLFRAGKSALIAPCERLHDEGLRRAYAAARRAGEPGYEAELARHLEDLAARNDREGAAAAARFAADGGPVPRVDADADAGVAAAAQRVAAAAAALEAAGATAAAALLEADLADALHDKALAQARAARAADAASPSAHRLCAACGGVLHLGDPDERMSQHFEGAVHAGFAAIRAALRDLRAQMGGAAAAAAAEVRPGA